MSIILKDGTVLPDLPSDVLAEYPYCVIKENSPRLVASKLPFWYVPAAIMNALVSMNFNAIGSLSAGAYYTLSGDEWVLYAPAAFGELFFNATEPLCWSNHNVGVSKTVNPSTLEVTGTGEVYFPDSTAEPKPPFVLPDGTELPALPDGCFDGTPYGVVVGVDFAGNGNLIYNAFFLSVPALALPVSLMPDDVGITPSSGTTHLFSLPPANYFKAYSLEGEEWDGGEDVVTELTPTFGLEIVLWANHDLNEVTTLNADDMSYTVGSTIARKSDENYRVTGGYMISIANEARRLGGKTSEMLPATVESIIKSAKSFPNGTQWTKSNVTSGYCDHKIVFGDGVWVAGKFFSKDGKTWNPTKFPAGFYDYSNYVQSFDLAYGNGVFCSGSRTKSGLCYSEDGETWTKSNIPDVNVYTPVYADGLWCAGTIDNGLYYSTDGKTWVQSNITSCNSLVSIRKVNGLWYATGPSNGLNYSRDGKTWTALNNPAPTGSGIKYHGGLFVGIKNNGGLLYSDDGITWTQSNITSGYFSTLVYANGIWVVKGASYLYYSTDGKSWTECNIKGSWYFASPASPIYRNGLWICAGNSDGLFYSDDGITWTQSNITSGNFSTPVYANGIWVAFDDCDSDTSLGIYYSKDGKTWTLSNIGIGRFTYILNENGIWVIGESQKGFYYSVTWE